MPQKISSISYIIEIPIPNNYCILIILAFPVSISSTPPGSAVEHQVKNLQDLTPEAALSRLSQSLRGNLGPAHQQQGAQSQSQSRQRTGADRSSGKSVSAEDLLEQTEERQTAPQHCRSHSSPTVETLNQVRLDIFIAIIAAHIS